MKLYTFPTAPSPQRVHLFLQEKGIEIPFEMVDMRANAQLSDEYKAINARGTVPALVLHDGTVISEVVAICAYLEAAYPDKPLLGSSPKQRALICEWDHRVEAECLMAIAEAMRNSSKAFKDRALPGPLDLEQIPELAVRGVIRLKAFLQVLDTQLSNNPFVAGDEFSVADITAFVSVGFSRWIKVEIPEELVHLQRWCNEIAARPAIAAKPA